MTHTDPEHTHYEDRFYRNWSESETLSRFEVRIAESDLLILCDRPLPDEARVALQAVRRDLEDRIAAQPEFATSLAPLPGDANAAPTVRSMLAAGRAWNVGPMAAVAGAVSEYVGRTLLEKSEIVFVENGGDIFAQSPRPVRFRLYAGEDSPFKGALAFSIPAAEGVAICTSSGKVGPSLSFGKADAVAAIHRDAAFADAAATALANQIHTPDDVAVVVERERERGLLDGLIACCGDKLGMWGGLELIR